MTVFWLVAALFVAGALLMLLPPLSRRSAPAEAAGEDINIAVHRDQWLEAERDLEAGLLSADRYDEVRREIGRRALEDVRATSPVPAAGATGKTGHTTATAWILAASMPLAAGLLYLLLGDPRMLAPAPVAAAAAPHALGRERIEAMVTSLGERLKARPDDREGWLMLARSYTTLGRHRDGALALRRAVELSPPNAGLLADLADLSGMAQGRRLSGEPARLIQQALDLDPKHPKALALAGSLALEVKDHAAARSYWQRLIDVLPPDSPMARSARGSLAEADQLERRAGATREAPAAVAADAAAVGGKAAVQGQVELAPELLARLPPAATLFVFARAAQGSRVPLAVLRRPADGRPFAFTLDDSQAMAPQLRLSLHPRVVIGARISASGSATPQAGDLVGESDVVGVPAHNVRVLIHRVQP